MKDTAAFWNKVSEKYAKTPIPNEDAYQLTLNKTRGYLKPTDHVLEVGCGTGMTAILLADSVDHITATDYATKMLEICKRNAQGKTVSNIDFEQAAITDASLPQKQYDAVLAHNILHLLEDIPAGVDAISKRVKPGGYFVSKTVFQFGPKTPLKWRLIKLALPLLQFLGKAPPFNLLSLKDLERTIEGGGFEILESDSYPKGHFSRYIVARKT